MKNTSSNLNVYIKRMHIYNYTVGNHMNSRVIINKDMLNIIRAICTLNVKSRVVHSDERVIRWHHTGIKCKVWVT